MPYLKTLNSQIFKKKTQSLLEIVYNYLTVRISGMVWQKNLQLGIIKHFLLKLYYLSHWFSTSIRLGDKFK